MPYADGMAVDRLSVTVPSELGAALRALASARGATVSTIVTEAIAHQVRLAALDRALAEADEKFGAVPEHLLSEARDDFDKAAKLARPRKHKPRRR